MYRVIIADDEESIRNRLISMVEKLKDDFMVVGSYSNGFDALESGISLEPDILITDIRMPYVTGIDLIRHFKMELPLIQSIIVSGYDSFDYAKEAISLGVVGYLTKPVVFPELKESLMKAKNVLDDQFKKDMSIKTLEEKAQSSLHLIQSEHWNRLIKVKDIPLNLKEKMAEDGIELNHPYQCMAIFDADSDNLGFDQEDLLYFYLKNAIDEELKNNHVCYYTFLSDEQFILHLEKEEPFDSEKLMLALNGILAVVKRAANISLSCGVSEIATLPINYRKLYRHAKRTLEYRTVLGTNMVLSLPDLEKENNDQNFNGKIDENEYKNITYLISYGKEEDFKEKIEDLIDEISSPKYKNNYYYILTNIFDAILKACISLPEFYQGFDSHVEIMKNIYTMKTKESLTDYCFKLAKRVYDVNQSKRISGLESSYERIYHYIEVNFANPNLSIEDVANELAYSVSYISAILKKNGTSFTKITTSLRMKKAVQLLLNSDERIINIAKEVGYVDPYYFSHCFKKYSGISPDDYRKAKTK